MILYIYDPQELQVLQNYEAQKIYIYKYIYKTIHFYET